MQELIWLNPLELVITDCSINPLLIEVFFAYMLGILLTSFYVVLYWYPSYLGLGKMEPQILEL
jgi:hypothetical protein